jgi:hypothetical protein
MRCLRHMVEGSISPGICLGSTYYQELVSRLQNFRYSLHKSCHNRVENKQPNLGDSESAMVVDYDTSQQQGLGPFFI